MTTNCLFFGICVGSILIAITSTTVRENQDEPTASALRAVESRLNQMEKKCQELEEKQQKRLQELEEESRQQAAEITYLKSSILLPDTIKEMIEKYSNGHRNLSRREIPNQVAFHSRITQSPGSLTENQIIRFDSVETNVGGGYDYTGIFRCTVPGTYVFAVTAVVLPRKGLELSIVKNGHVIGSIYAWSVHDGIYDSGSNLVIVDLQGGDSVWVKVNGRHHDVNDVIDVTFTTFSGFLL